MKQTVYLVESSIRRVDSAGDGHRHNVTRKGFFDLDRAIEDAAEKLRIQAVMGSGLKYSETAHVSIERGNVEL